VFNISTRSLKLLHVHVKLINIFSNIDMVLVVLDLGLGIIIDAQSYLHGISVLYLIDDDHYQ
jgi:hypothetical protein